VTAVTLPTDIGSLAIWLDASDSSTLFQDAAATTSASAASDPVGCWKDKSGNNRHYTGSSTTRPLLAIAKHNGRNSIYFDGVDDLLGVNGSATTNTNSTLTDSTGACAWVVYEPNSDTDYAVLKFANSASGYERFTNGATYHTYFRTSRFGALSPAPPTSGLTLLASSASVASDSQLLRINGTTTISQTCATTFAAWRALTSQAWTVGQDAAFLNGWVSEVIVLGREATAAEVAKVEKYLAAKWGISGVHAQATATSDPVGAWLDKSGNARHAVQATASYRGTVGTQGARRAITLDGTDDHLLLGNLSAAFPTAGEVVTAYALNAVDSSYTVYQTSDNSNSDVFGSLTFAGAFRTTRLQGLTFTGPSSIGTHLWGVSSQSSGYNLWVEGSQAFTTTSDHTGGTNHAIGMRSATPGVNQAINGKLLEVCAFNRVLTSSERVRLNRYLAARWGITLAPTVSNADAQDWINRVYANGGTVSSSTAAAVSAFCDSIDSASGLRACFSRLNLFCGGTSGTTAGLAACLVPLYRSTAYGGTVLGSATDANTGSFVVGDYAETGASGGLLGLSGKYLDTGFNVNNLTASSFHLSSYIRGTQSVTTPMALIGALFNGVTDRFRLYVNATGTPASTYTINSELGVSTAATATLNNSNAGLMLASRTLATDFALYDDGVSAGTNNTSTSGVVGATPLLVFARTGPTEHYTGRMAGYSIGAGMTSAQALAYSNAMTAFQTALSRNA
jgi:hypothetical protein